MKLTRDTQISGPGAASKKTLTVQNLIAYLTRTDEVNAVDNVIDPTTAETTIDATNAPFTLTLEAPPNEMRGRTKVLHLPPALLAAGDIIVADELEAGGGTQFTLGVSPLRVGGVWYDGPGGAGHDFTAAHVVTAAKFGGILIQVALATNLVSTKVVGSPQAYDSPALALAALPAPDAGNVKVAHIVLEAAGENWTANADALGAAAGLQFVKVETFTGIMQVTVDAEFIGKKGQLVPSPGREIVIPATVNDVKFAELDGKLIFLSLFGMTGRWTVWEDMAQSVNLP